jgi:aryl-alcohol dehydrogenase
MVTVSAAVVERHGAPFTIRELELDDPRPHEVLVRMVAAGLCHTDLGVRAGGVPFRLPGVLGHEGAGVVERVGADVTDLAQGDRVLLSFDSCGDCVNCRAGHPAYCEGWMTRNVLTGLRPDGTPTLRHEGAVVGGHFFGQSSFATYALAAVRDVVPLPADAPLDVLAPLGCAVQTGFGTVWNVLAPEPGTTLAVFGAGAVGLSAVMAAVLLPLVTVIAVDRLVDRLALARELGATHTVDAGTAGAGGVAAALAEITGGRGLDHAIDATGDPGVVRTAVDALGMRGTCAIVGAPPFGTEVSLDVPTLLVGKRIVGVTLGDSDPRTLLPQLVTLHQHGRLPLEKLIRHYALDDIESAAADMHDGKTVKPVIRF